MKGDIQMGDKNKEKELDIELTEEMEKELSNGKGEE